MFSRRRHVTSILLLVALGVSACGGSDDGGTSVDGRSDTSLVTDDSAPEPGDAGTPSAAVPEGFTVPEQGFDVVNGLIPELAGVAVPEPALYRAGTALGPNQDPRETASQSVFSTLEQLDLVAFYFDNMASSDISIPADIATARSVDEVPADGRAIVIPIVRTDGLKGELTIEGGATVSASQVRIDIFYASS